MLWLSSFITTFYLLHLFFNHKCMIYTNIITQSLSLSSPEETSSLSPGLLTMAEQLKAEETLGKSIVAYLSTNLISADMGKQIKLDLPYENGDIGTDIMEMLYISKTGRFFTVKKYIIDYDLNPNHIINSIHLSSNKLDEDDLEETKHKKKSNNKSKYYVECLYKITNNTFTMTPFQIKTYDKYLRYSYITFILNKTGKRVYDMFYSNNKIIVEDIVVHDKNEKSYLKNMEIKELFLIDQKYDNDAYLCFLNYKNELYIYKINLDEMNKNYTLLFEIKIDIQTEETIYKIGKINGEYILSIKNKGICKYNSDEGLRELNSTYNYIDFIVCKKTLYAIAENKGLVIFRLSDMLTYYKEIDNLKLQSLDHYVNPFYNHHFIGITVSPLNEGSEVFIELIITSEFFPLINKVFTAPKTFQFTNFYLLDAFFTYTYEKTTNTIFLIRRGLLNSLPFITYKLPLEKLSSINLITSLYDNTTDTHIPALISSSDSVHLVQNFQLAKHKLNCTFNDDGKFNLTLIQHGEVCANSLEQSRIRDEFNDFVICQKIVSYNFHIYASNSTAFTIVFSFCIGFILLVFVVLFCILTCNTNCFRKMNKLRITEMNKDKEVYQSVEMKECVSDKEEVNDDVDNYSEKHIDNINLETSDMNKNTINNIDTTSRILNQNDNKLILNEVIKS